MNLAKNIERSQHLFPDKPALIFEGKSFTYRELNEMSNRIANGLSELGISRGDRVALFLPNIPAFVTAYLGIQKIGAVPVSINSALKAEEVKYIIEDSGALILITTEVLRANVLAEEISQLKQILIAEGDAKTDRALSELMANASPTALAIEMAPEDPAAILYTSGTTGFPKGATLSHDNLVSNIRTFVDTVGTHSDDRILLFLPASHSYGQTSTLFPCLEVGATLVLHRELEIEGILKSIVDNGVTTFFGVSTIYTLLYEKASVEQMRTIRRYVSGGAPLPLELANKWRDKFGVSINEEYGSTETSLICFNQTYQPGSVGSVLEGVEVKLIDSETGQEVKPGELGEVLVRGPNVMLGYWNRPTETAQVLKEGWFHTGDIGRIDEEGYFYLVDRIKDMVNVGGLKVYPSEVENILYQHPAVAEVAVYGVPEPLLGEQVIASIIPKSGMAVTTEEIVAFCRQNMADFKVPNLVELVDSLPKGRTGKILKKILREQFKPRSSMRDESSRQKSPESLKQWLSDWLETELALDPETIETDRAFADYGLNSTLAVVLAQDLSEWLEQPIEPIITWNYPTIEQITAHLLTDRVEALPTKTVEPKAELSEVLHSSADTKEAELPASATEATSLGQPEPIAIIGMGCRFPGGANTPAQFWELLHNGVDTVTDIPKSRWNVEAHYDPRPNQPGKMYMKAGSFLEGIDQFDPQFFGIVPREAANMDPQQRLLLEISWEALEHAGIAPAQLRESLTGVFVATFSDDYSALHLSDPSQIDAYRTLSSLRGLAAGRIAYVLGLQGPTMQLDTGCSSSLLAMHLACQSLRQKECNLALAGGVTLNLLPELAIGLCSLNTLAPDGRCKTFDAKADGFGLGEGCGMVILKRFSDAIRDGDNIMALIRGSAVNHDGRSNGLTAPNGLAQEALFRQALSNSAVKPDQIQYVEMHGAGTPLGDPIEVLALANVLGRERRTPLMIGSVKTNLGHLASASGIASLIKVVLSLQQAEIPPHLHFTEPSPHIPWDKLPFRVPIEPTPWTDETKLAGVSSFSMSGTNVHLIVEQAPKTQVPKVVEPEYPILLLSAKNKDRLQALAQKIRDFLDQQPAQISLANITYTLQVCRDAMAERLAIVAFDLAELKEKLTQYVQKKTGVENCYHGNTKSHKSQSKLLLDGRAGKEFLKIIIEDREFTKLAQLWVSGIDIDWQLLYGKQKPQRISLPTYPFARERYWLSTVEPSLKLISDDVTNMPSPVSLSENQLLETVQKDLLNTVLAISKIDEHQIDSNQRLDEYGFDSIGFLTLANQLNEMYNLEIESTLFFKYASIVSIAQFLCDKYQNGLYKYYQTRSDAVISTITTKVPSEEVGASLTKTASKLHEPVDTYPLSHGQQALWFLYQLAPTSVAYNTALTLRIRSTLSVSALQNTFQALLNRHPCLRTTFTLSEGEPLQKINQYQPVSFEQIDASNWSWEELNKRVIEAYKKPFNLEQGPVLRVNLFTRAQQDHILLLTIHHIVFDAWSLWMLIEELGTIYPIIKAGRQPSLPPIKHNYADYVRWQSEMLVSAKGERLWAYWQQQLAGELPVLNFPTDYPRPPIQTYQGASVRFVITETLTQQLQELARTEGATLYTIILAIYQILLYRYTGQEDILVGSPTTGRTQNEFTNLVGYFVNPVVLRTKAEGALTFKAFLGQVQQTVLAALEHQDYPFPLLVERLQPNRDPSRSPIFQVDFIYQKPQQFEQIIELFIPGETEVKVNLGELELEPFEMTQQEGQFDLTLEMMKVKNSLVGTFNYNTDLFKATTMNRMVGHFQTLLEGIIANPLQKISQLPLLTAAEQHQLLVEWNATQSDYPSQCLHQLFEIQAEKTPNRVAIIFEQQQLTYQELNSQANQLAHYLQTLGIKPEAMVGICLERSPLMVIGLMGILKAGGAYLPLDPAYPAARLAFMLEDAQVPVLLIQSNLLDRVPKTSSQQVVCLDAETEAWSQLSTANPVNEMASSNLAYVIYTSGSTGNPKGVLGTHEGMVNRLVWMWETYPFETSEVCCHRTSMNFVDHIAELFSPLLKGFPVVLLSEEKMRDVIGIIDMLYQHKITRLVLVPSLLKTILELGPQELQKLEHIKYWCCSGEALSSSVVKLFAEKFPNGRLLNIYGSSEVSADVLAYKVERQDISTILNYFSPELSNSSLPFEKSLPQESITTPGVEIDKLKQTFKTQAVPLFPQKQETYYAYLKEHVLPYLVNTSSPRFIGHMTSALPSFNYELTDLVLKLNQNMVKVETSKSLVFLERQAMAMLHHAFYGFPDSFYDEYAQQSEKSLGITVSGGTTANISALWVARNLALSEDDTFPGVAQAGLNAALEHYGYKNIVLLGSHLMHYSIRKAASLLGLGKDNILYIDQDENGKIDIVALRQCIEDCRQKQWCILALIGIAGATETGDIDPLEEMADIASTFNIHFHVDAAWGGPVIFSEQHQSKLKGIEKADSITLCGHKQLYLPMGISFCVFRQPNMAQAIATSATYQAREGSYDFGRYSPEGSRASLSICLHAAFHLIGKQGYAELIDEGIDKALYLKARIEENEAFELIKEPELNIVNFRYIPTLFRTKQRNGQLTAEDNLQINQANIQLQDLQFQQGRAFISRTQLSNTRHGKDLPIVVGRAVLANPLTTYQDIDFVLEDQLTIAANAIEIGSQNNQETLTNKSKITAHTGKRSSRRSNLAKELLEKYTVPIGKPIFNTQVYILDRQQKPVPIGVLGELYVGGAGLARGYFNRSELTTEKFVKHPFSDDPNARLYKTGDLARYLSDGNIEYLGRIDNQVKIRGFRIELGEVESALLQHSAVQEVIVVPREYPPGEKNLVAYVVPNQTISSRELRNELKKKLPGYMVPAAFVMLEAMPMTPNGKLDRRALPAPEHSLTQKTPVISSNIQPTEKRLAAIWSEVLGRKEIGIHEIFFEIGGTSLLATRVIFKIRETLSIPLAVSDLFESPTIAGLAEVIDDQNGSKRVDKLEIPGMPQDEDEALFKTLERMKLNELNVDEVAQLLFN